MKAWIILLLGLATAPVAASESDTKDAVTALNSGQFELALTLGQQAKTANGFMVACRAGMVMGGYYEKGAKAVESLHVAINNCNKAVSLDPTNVNAWITLAIGVGFEGKRWKKPALAKTARRLLEQTYQQFPNEPAAHAAIGGWHAEVTAAGWLARLYLGASRSKAKGFFSEAAAMGETDLPFALEYLKLLARGNKQDRLAGLTLANTYLTEAPDNAVDTLILAKMRPLVDALENGNKKEIKKAIAYATAFNDIEEWRDTPPLNLDFLERLVTHQE